MLVVRKVAEDAKNMQERFRGMRLLQMQHEIVSPSDGSEVPI